MSDPTTFRVGVLASGTGTNLQAILDQLHGGGQIEVVAVGSDKRAAQALDRAAQAGVETAVFERAAYPDREARDLAMAEWLDARDVQLVVLAGYMQLLSAAFVRRVANRIIHLHPAPPPAVPRVRSHPEGP